MVPSIGRVQVQVLHGLENKNTLTSRSCEAVTARGRSGGALARWPAGPVWAARGEPGELGLGRTGMGLLPFICFLFSFFLFQSHFQNRS